MSSQLFCELYVDTDESIESVKEILERHCLEVFQKIVVEVVVYRNEDYQPSARQSFPYSAILCSPYHVEIDATNTNPGLMREFHVGTADLVRFLRAGGRFVTASCDFEDLIADLTGWNWTKESPEPPGR